MLEPINKTIEVPCSQKMAFEVFLHEMDTWWPTKKFATSVMAGSSVRSLTVEARVGGKIVESGNNDVEYEWGTIRTYDPHDAFSMDFHIAHPDFPVDGWTLVEVSFIALGDASTRVELTQSNWEFLGDMAEGARGGYNAAWDMILGGAYRSRCEG